MVHRAARAAGLRLLICILITCTLLVTLLQSISAAVSPQSTGEPVSFSDAVRSAVSTQGASVEINVPSMADGQIVWLDEYQLSDGDSIQYRVSAERGQGLQVGFARPSDTSADPAFYAVSNLRQDDEPLVCDAQFTCGPPVPAGPYRLFVRAIDGPLENVSGTFLTGRKADSSFLCEPLPDGTVSITGYSGNVPAQLRIPAAVSGHSVSAIADWAFAYEAGITSVTIPETVYRIGQCAFRECSALTSVVLPQHGITELGEEAFLSCRRLRSIHLPESLTMLGENAFWGCSQLGSATISPLLTEIPEGTFGYCSSLTEIEIPDTVERIGALAFAGTGLTSLCLPSSVLEIDHSALSDCTSLTSLEIKGPVIDIPAYMATNCTALETVQLPSTISSIGESAFSHCTSLRGLRLPASLQTLGTQTFWGCSSLHSIVIPEGVEVIPFGTFWDCTELTMVGLPITVQEIAPMAFYRTNLVNIYYAGSKKQWNAVTVGDLAQDQIGTEVLDSNSVLRDAVTHFHEEMPLLPPDVSIQEDSPLTVQNIPELDVVLTGYTAAALNTALTVSDLQDQFVLPAGMWCVVHAADDTAKDINGTVATGDTVVLRTGNGPQFTATMVVMGDVTGSGILNLSQLVRLARAYTDAAPLAGPYLVAGDFLGTGSIELSDLVREAQLYTSTLTAHAHDILHS